MLTKIIWRADAFLGSVLEELKYLDKSAVIDVLRESDLDVDPSKMDYARLLRKRGFAESVLFFTIPE
jgi:hypothetical protein